MKKKAWICTLLAVVVLCCGIAGISCKSKLTIENWTDTTENVELGDTYTVETGDVIASDGNAYEVTAEVKDSNGNLVPVHLGQINITDIGGYSIKYTAANLSRTVTLVVHDGNKPVIRMGQSVAIGWVNEFFEFPTLSVTDDSGEPPVIEKTLTLGTGADAQPVEFEETGFTPKDEGRYYFIVTATDGSGNESTAQTAFYARNKPAENVIETFDVPETVSLAYNNETVNLSYEEGDIGGKTGALKMEILGGLQWPWLYVKPAFDLTNYEKYDFYSFSIYIDPNGLPEERVAKKLSTGDKDQHVVKVGEWTEIAAPIEQLLMWESAERPGYYGLFNFLNDSAESDSYRLRDDSFTVYIRDIVAHEETAAENVVAPLDSVTLTARLISNQSAVTYCEEGIAGRKNIARLDMWKDDLWPSVNVYSRIDLTECTDKYIGFWLYIDGSTLDTPKTGKAIEQEGRMFLISVDRWTYIARPVSDLDLSAESTCILSWLNDDNSQSALRGKDTHFTYYMSEITVFDRTAKAGNELNFLNDYAAGDDVAVTDGLYADNKTIMASSSYDVNAPGDSEAVRLDVLAASGYPGLWIRPRAGQAAENVTVRFEMYIDKASLNRDDATRKIFVVRENGNEVRKYVTPDTWVTLETTLSLKNDMGDFWGLGFFLNDNIQDGADTDGRIHDETFTFYVKNVQII